MTEEVLERANDLAKRMKEMKERKKYLEEAQQRYWGNTSDVLSRHFSMKIVEHDGRSTVVRISADSAKEALDADIKTVSESLIELQREFAELS